MNGGSLSRTLGGWRLERQVGPSAGVAVLSRLAAVVLALVVAGIAIQLTGRSAFDVARQAVQSTLGSRFGIEEAIILATPIIMTGLAVIIAMRIGTWNIGVEGQLFVGGLGAAAVGLNVKAPAFIAFLAMFLAGAAGGALWVFIPALLRAYFELNEIITTLMLNFVAVMLVEYFTYGPWRDTNLKEIFATPRIPYELPTLAGGSAHIGIFVAIAIAILMAIVFRYTRWGYEIAIIGANRKSAQYAGMPVVRYIFIVMLVSGAVAGMAGTIEVTGVAHRLTGVISNGYGYLGFLVAVLSNASPLVMVVAGFLYATLVNAGIALQTIGLSIHAVLAITGLIIVFAAIGEVASHYRVIRRPSFFDDEAEQIRSQNTT